MLSVDNDGVGESVTRAASVRPFICTWVQWTWCITAQYVPQFESGSLEMTDHTLALPSRGTFQNRTSRPKFRPCAQ
jgi:hypothetical protein